jgi:hypothetical protein
MTMRWESVSGTGYVLQYRTNLLSGSGWADLLTITAQSSSISTNLPLTDKNGFYRIRINQ